jgi:4-hydroxybenzoate polyprenyltransferase
MPSYRLPRPLEKARAYLDLVKFEHTVFALPFAYAGMLLAAQGWPGWRVFLLVTIAMAGARTAAMAANRLIDAGIDSLNPRTAGRHIPSGAVRPFEALALAVVSLAVLSWAAWQLGPLPLTLLPIAVVFLVIYPYTKRFTWLCHAWLGVTDGAAAAGGWIAVTGAFETATWLLWLVVVFWMIGLDVIYATMDYDFDRRHGIQSVPRRFGIGPGLAIARASHLLTWLLLVAVGLAAGSAWPYYMGVAVMGGILLYEHAIVRPSDLRRANEAFFTANGWLAVTMLAAVALDVAVR